VTKIKRLRLSDHLPEPISHYADAVRAGGWLYISGMLALDRDGTVVGGNDVAAQTERVLENIGAALRAEGAGFENVVKVNVFVRRIGDRAAINAVRRRFFGDSRPASTLVEVSAFVVPDALVEIDAVAYLGGR
jgi:2-iminobutanoate/2-iminopropanoate deaminase